MTANHKWIKLVIVQYVLAVGVIIGTHYGMINSFLGGMLGIVIMVPLVIKMIIENKLFTPITPTLIFEVSFFLYLMKLVRTYESLPLEAMLIFQTCMFLWKIITICSRGFKKDTRLRYIEKADIPQKSFTVVVSVLFLLSAAAMFFEWKMAGGIPILRSDQETFRFTVSYSAITHLLAIMNKVVATLIGVYLINKGSIKLKTDFLLVLEMIIAELLMVGTAMRGEMIMAPCIIFVFFAIKYRIPLKFYVLAGILALLFIGVLPLVRMYNNYGPTHIANLKALSTYPQWYMFTPLYQSFSNNFEILNLDLSIFPQLKEFGYGAYTILPEIPFVDLGKNLMALQNEVLNNNFYSGLTATFYASWYADFGYAGFVLATLLYAGITIFAFNRCIMNRDLFSYVWYAYTFYSALWIFYNGTFNFVYICYSIVIWFAIKMKVRIE